jgi:hypothetical protein
MLVPPPDENGQGEQERMLPREYCIMKMWST